MNAAKLLDACAKAGIDFFTGVPDSQLKGLCDTLYARYGVQGDTHIVAANEGNAIGLAAGHYLATGRPALVQHYEKEFRSKSGMLSYARLHYRHLRHRRHTQRHERRMGRH